MKELDKQHEHLKPENAILKEIIKKLERYKMQWCLKLNGLTEMTGKNVKTNKQVIFQFFIKVAPNFEVHQLDDAVDLQYWAEEGQLKQDIF